MKLIKWSALIAASLMFVFGTNLAYGSKIEVDEAGKIGFSDQTTTPIDPKCFCITDDGLFIISDYGAGDLKIYEESFNSLTNKSDLELVGTIGRKGYGPEGLVKPYVCSYNKEENKLSVLDLGNKKVLIYSRLGRLNFQRELVEIPCKFGAYDIKLFGDTLYVAGYTNDSDGQHYSFYSADLNAPNNINYLLSSNDFYNFRKGSNFREQFEEKRIASIGIMGFFSIRKGSAHIAWKGDLRILKLDLSTNGKPMSSFGTKTKKYKKPFLSSQLVDSYYNKADKKSLRKLKRNMTYIKRIFSNSDSILVVYEGPVKKNQKEGTNYLWAQTYSLNGKLKGEATIAEEFPHAQGDSPIGMNGNFLYSLIKNGDKYTIKKYHVINW